MDESYVLDTSAIFAFTKDEESSQQIEQILSFARKGKTKIFISFISFLELYYITWQEKDEKSAKKLFLYLKSWPIERVDSNEKLILIAGGIKANYKLSVADSIIIATAIEKKSTLIHKDPELEVVKGETEILSLPYKKRKSKW